MQKDLISKQEAIDTIMGQPPEPHYPSWYAAQIEKLPAAQPERNRGYWIEVDDHYNRISGRCSVCGWESHMYEDDVVGMDFCPNCGADMRGR